MCLGLNARGQLAGACLLLSLCGPWASNSGHQVWWQSPLPSSHLACPSIPLEINIIPLYSVSLYTYSKVGWAEKKLKYFYTYTIFFLLLCTIKPFNKSYMSWRNGSTVKEKLLLLQRIQVGFPAPARWLTTVCHIVPGDSMPSFALEEHQGCKWCTDIHTGRTIMHIQ